jgi:hypothetical protein
MNFIKKLTLLSFVLASMSLTGCLDIEEEVTYRANGSGSYAMRLDMSQMKSMLEMFKNMGGDEKGKEAEGKEGVVSDMEPVAPATPVTEDNAMEVAPEEAPEEPIQNEKADAAASENPAEGLTQLGAEFDKSLESLKVIKGIKNAKSLNDTSALMFGYTFEFDNVESLNKAIVAMNKDKFEGKTANAFVAGKKSFERTSAFDMGSLIAQAMSENDEAAESMDMIKMFFGDMKYKQVYHFDQKVKKSGNSNAVISPDGKTVTLIAKPFAEGENSKTVANVLKLK